MRHRHDYKCQAGFPTLTIWNELYLLGSVLEPARKLVRLPQREEPMHGFRRLENEWRAPWRTFRSCIDENYPIAVTVARIWPERGVNVTVSSRSRDRFPWDFISSLNRGADAVCRGEMTRSRLSDRSVTAL